MHRILLEQSIPDIGQTLVIEGDEAVHAIRVKRLESGDRLGLSDGAGMRAIGTIEAVHRAPKHRQGPSLEVRVTERAAIPPLQPALHVLTATPKGARVDDLVDQLSQIGAASWAPLSSIRGVVDPREGKLTRLERIAKESAKQSGRAWLLEIRRGVDIADALKEAETGPVIFADGSGEVWNAENAADGSPLTLLIGPEGGWTESELDSARAAGARVVRFGPHTMRIETAAVAAAAVILARAAPAGA